MNDTDCFLGLHDRKLYVLGLCRIISLGREKAHILAKVADKVLPSLLLIFKGLKRNYRSRAKKEEGQDKDGLKNKDAEVKSLGLCITFIPIVPILLI